MKSAVSLRDLDGLVPEDVFDLKTAYNNYLAAIHKKSNRGGVFHPSAVGMCGRNNVYEYLGYEADLEYAEPRVAEIFLLGHKIHEILQERVGLLDAGKFDPATGNFKIRALHEVPTPRGDHLLKTLGLAGTSDSLAEITADGILQRGIIEFKSIGDEGFKEIQARGPKPEHLQQLHVYMYRFDCPVGWVFYYHKTTSKIEVFPVVFDYELFYEITAKVYRWKRLADSGNLPEREESFFGCQDCKYRHTCRPTVLHRRHAGSRLSRLRRKHAKA